MPQRQQIFFHFLGWVGFLILPVLIVPRSIFEQSSTVEVFRVTSLLLTNLILIAFYYLNYFVLLPKYWFRRKKILYILLCGAVLVFILTAPILIFPKPDFIPFSQATAQQAVAQIVFMYLLVLFASISSRNSTEWHQAEEQRKIAEKNKLSAELSYLKAQINPHFLFNTLNSIYTLALKKSDNAAEAVIQLAALMRYVLTDAQQAFVPIQQEINYISGYIDLQKMRLSEMTRLDFQITGQSVGNKIAPFLLIPFIENAFKFGLSTETDSTIEIFIKLGEGSLAMVITNPAIQNHVLKVQSTGIGIELTRQRLALIYPQRHSLDITTKANTFIVSLEIQLRCSIA